MLSIHNYKKDPKETEKLLETEKDLVWDFKERLSVISTHLSFEESGQSVKLDE